MNKNEKSYCIWEIRCSSYSAVSPKTVAVAETEVKAEAEQLKHRNNPGPSPVMTGPTQRDLILVLWRGMVFVQWTVFGPNSFWVVSILRDKVLFKSSVKSFLNLVQTQSVRFIDLFRADRFMDLFRPSLCLDLVLSLDDPSL